MKKTQVITIGLAFVSIALSGYAACYWPINVWCARVYSAGPPERPATIGEVIHVDNSVNPPIYTYGPEKGACSQDKLFQTVTEVPQGKLAGHVETKPDWCLFPCSFTDDRGNMQNANCRGSSYPKVEGPQNTQACPAPEL